MEGDTVLVVVVFEFAVDVVAVLLEGVVDVDIMGLSRCGDDAVVVGLLMAATDAEAAPAEAAGRMALPDVSFAVAVDEVDDDSAAMVLAALVRRIRHRCMMICPCLLMLVLLMRWIGNPYSYQVLRHNSISWSLFIVRYGYGRWPIDGGSKKWRAQSVHRETLHVAGQVTVNRPTPSARH